MSLRIIRESDGGSWTADSYTPIRYGQGYLTSTIAAVDGSQLTDHQRRTADTLAVTVMVSHTPRVGQGETTTTGAARVEEAQRYFDALEGQPVSIYDPRRGIVGPYGLERFDRRPDVGGFASFALTLRAWRTISVQTITFPNVSPSSPSSSELDGSADSGAQSTEEATEQVRDDIARATLGGAYDPYGLGVEWY